MFGYPCCFIWIFSLGFKNVNSDVLSLSSTHEQAQEFRTQGTQIRRKMWFQNMKIKLIVLAIIIALILIIILSACHGFNCGKKN